MISIFGNVIVPLKKRIKEVYLADRREASYAAYRNITGRGIVESHRAVKPWIIEWDKEWEGKK
jgi:hypothetical protein